MVKYMVLYRSTMSAGEQMAAGSPEQAQAGMELWMKWAGKVGNAMVDMGSPLSTVGVLGDGAGASGSQSVGGFSIIEADSADAAKKLLDDHPHFHGPGRTSIEVLEFLPVPGS
jgi:hypothetical protein